jgi:hypothetical protein
MAGLPHADGEAELEMPPEADQRPFCSTLAQPPSPAMPVSSPLIEISAKGPASHCRRGLSCPSISVPFHPALSLP